MMNWNPSPGLLVAPCRVQAGVVLSTEALPIPAGEMATGPCGQAFPTTQRSYKSQCGIILNKLLVTCELCPPFH